MRSAFFVERAGAARRLRGRLKAAPDLARALSRLALDRGGPRDLAAVRDGLLRAARRWPQRAGAAPPAARGLARAMPRCRRGRGALAARLGEALAESLPLNRRDGGFVRPGFEPTLDELRALRDESRSVIAGTAGALCELAETRQLKIKHNNFLGYFHRGSAGAGREAAASRPSTRPSSIARRWPTRCAFRPPNSPSSKRKISSAADRGAGARAGRFSTSSRRQCCAQKRDIKRAAEALAAIDVAAALAELAATRDWTRPEVDASLAFVIEGGRHPVVEAALCARGRALRRQ